MTAVCGRRSRLDARPPCQPRFASERRSRLLELDAPLVTPKELTGSLALTEKVAADRDLFLELTVGQMTEIAADSQALVDRMRLMAQANRAIGLCAHQILSDGQTCCGSRAAIG